MKLALDSTQSNFVLSLSSQTGPITYQLALSAWNCCGPNTLNGNTGTSQGASLVLTGVDCSCVAPFCATCDFCAGGTYPKAYGLTVSGFAD